MIQNSKGEKTFLLVNSIVLSIFALMTVYPFIYVLSASISSGDAVITGKVLFFPKEITFDAYRRVLAQSGIWIAYANTVYYTVAGVFVNLVLTICGAYPLSKKRLMGKKFITFFVVFTMWFHAGMIPFYLNLRSLDLLNTRTAIIIAFGISTFYVILMRTFFQSIPDSLEEAAIVDGANDLQVLLKIFLPLSRPALATLGLFYGVSRWNGYFWAMVILNDSNKAPLQVILKRLLIEMTSNDETMDMVHSMNYNRETIIYATIIVSILPIIAVYPYLQKHFVKGIMLGSVKG